MDRNERVRLVWRAEAYERRTKPHGRAIGALGLTGVALLRVIAFRFLNAKQNRAWPSYDTLQRETGFCRQTIARGIQRLEAAGFLLVTRRAGSRGRGRIVRETNLYALPSVPPAVPDFDSPLVRREPKPQDFIPWDRWQSPLKDALEALGRRVAEANNGLARDKPRS
jgi:hypothetical protein